MPKLEIERKFIIRRPDITSITKMPEYTRSEILQIYVSAPAGITHRVRRRTYKNRVEYTETVKLRRSKMSSHEDEALIDEARFNELAADMAEGTSAVKKTRHTFKHGEHTFEIDIYPTWHNTCIMEVELDDEGEKISMPDIVRLVREVTGDKKYSNASMARLFPKEDEL